MKVKNTNEVKEANVQEAPTQEKAKRTVPTNSPLPSVQPLNAGEIGAPDIAKMIGCDPRELRNYLRKTARDMGTDAKGTRYRWTEGDPEIQKIIDGFNADKAVKAAAPKGFAKKKVEVTEKDGSAEDVNVDAVEEITDEAAEIENLDDLDIDITD